VRAGVDLAEFENGLKQVQHILSNGRPSDGAEEWLLVTTIIGEADLALQEARGSNPTVELPLLDAVVAELYEMTAGFTDPEFLRATKPARRQNPRLFG
jgi:hypothetical protein